MTEVQRHSAHTLVFRSLKRTHEFFLSDQTKPPVHDEKADKLMMSCKVRDEYSVVKDLVQERDRKRLAVMPVTAPYGDGSDGQKEQHGSEVHVMGTHPYPSGPGVTLGPGTSQQAGSDYVYHEDRDGATTAASVSDIQLHAGLSDRYAASAANRSLVAIGDQKMLVPKKAITMPKPVWHPPWKLFRVISGHQGWVRGIDVEPGNEWFVTGAADRMIKIWDLATGTLKLSLTGHVSTVRAVGVSPRQPYLFSAGEDKQVKCWDLEYNKVIRHYHGHLSAVYSLDIHPTIDILVTCGRDATARVWDMRTKAQIHCLAGHTNTVAQVRCQAAEPQVITASHDSTVRLWDLAAGRSLVTLTNHKKSVRSLVIHPTLHAMATASPDNIKQWKFPDGNFLQNLSGHTAIVNTLALNQDNVLVSGGDNGTMYFWDWRSGYNFQRLQAAVQPGSIDSEAGIFASTFDRSGCRLITCEADKTIKIYKEDESANEETHPIHWKADIFKKRQY
jgi:pleiotropic regulator 1